MNTETIRGRDIVIVGQQPWDVEIGSNCKNIAIELSKYNRVLYVNQALDRITLMKNAKDPKVMKRRNVIKGKEDGLIPVSTNLWNLFPDVLVESINWISQEGIFDYLNKRNNKLLAGSILKAMQVLDFKTVILFNDNDMFRSFYLPELLAVEQSVYYSRDYMLAVDYWKKHGTRIEPLLIAKSDVCVANSTYLTDYCKQYNANSHYIGQGCDLELFSGLSDQDVVPEIMELPGIKVGYVGALQHIRLDIDLLSYLAQHNPDWSIVLVGPEDEVFRSSALHGLSNVYFLGSQKPEHLPKYINSFDVCINPQLINEVTIGNYPRKIDEYLATGKPVVATLTQAVNIFKDCVYLSEHKEEFVTLIKKAIAENSKERAAYRQSVASSHTWENSVNELYKAINNVI
ncbi:glycosyltransferase [Pedobacter caeni]|uniref:Glycosyltransferase involved in cell wall bisynthesis n=1 Tax=Pedobacter caeni TaxID=288992 RepID=A0A1M4WUP3_9SPHI|nr:glycosyltransferase [Pedobacter caeni]SHE84682.1 Glycosyltransferase involved in cell wall bisynthesis [Pedobacter caeni]